MQKVIMAGRNAEKRANQVLRKVGVTYPQFEVMQAIRSSGDLNMGNVADQMNVSRGNLTGITNRMEANGLIERSRRKEDRRAVGLTLTAKGSTVLGQAETALAPLFAADVPEGVANWLERVFATEAEATEPVVA